MLLVRASARRENREPSHGFPSPVPSDAETAAETSLRATLAAGNPWSQNQLMARFGLTRLQATKVRELVTAEANGQHPRDAGEPSPDN
jgi:hypothetical protein